MSEDSEDLAFLNHVISRDQNISCNRFYLNRGGNYVSKNKFVDNVIVFNILMTLSKLSVMFNYNLAIMYNVHDTEIYQMEFGCHLK